MTRFVCHFCGTQHADAPRQRRSAPTTASTSSGRDSGGRRWRSWRPAGGLGSLDGDVLGIGLNPSMPIPQRALFATTDAGNVLWDCLAVVTPRPSTRCVRGGVTAIAISHPHFYTAMVEWSDALGGVPIYLHEADRGWVQARRRRSSTGPATASSSPTTPR